MEASLVFLLFSPLLECQRKTLSGGDPRTIFLVRFNFLQLWPSHHGLNRADSLLAASLPAKEHLQQKSCPGACAAVTLQQQGVPRVLAKCLFPGTVYSLAWVNQAQPAEGKCCWWDCVPAGSRASSAMPGRDQTLLPFHSSVGSSPEVSLHLPAVKAALAILNPVLLFCGTLLRRESWQGWASPGTAQLRLTLLHALHRSLWQRKFYTAVLGCSSNGFALCKAWAFFKASIHSAPTWVYFYCNDACSAPQGISIKCHSSKSMMQLVEFLLLGINLPVFLVFKGFFLAKI